MTVLDLFLKKNSAKDGDISNDNLDNKCINAADDRDLSLQLSTVIMLRESGHQP